MNIEENAVALLLRSPRLDVGTIMDVLDLGDREFREMMLRNPRALGRKARGNAAFYTG